MGFLEFRRYRIERECIREGLSTVKNSFGKFSKIVGICCLVMGITHIWAVASNIDSGRQHRHDPDQISEECREYAWADRSAVFGTSNPKFLLKKWCIEYSADIRKADLKSLPDKEIVEACEDYTKATSKGPIYGVIDPQLWSKSWCSAYSPRIREIQFEAFLEKVRQSTLEWEQEERAKARQE
jgi:hypothetical protein